MLNMRPAFHDTTAIIATQRKSVKQLATYVILHQKAARHAMRHAARNLPA